ncbi:MAG TPA: ligase-associated DNA damage response endonuclease PdeM, partial [Lunatimonas sp.]|nr:ligase-associated DNA damage response endonuclease PdeM [Lunatimonas sp.]
ESLTLLTEKALWIPATKRLFLADTHFGKAGHFRKAGIPIPEEIHTSDFHKLGNLLANLQPSEVYILGDLFHSDWNGEWDAVKAFFLNYSDIDFHLILGNHDILKPFQYRQTVLQVHETGLIVDEFILSHEPLAVIPAGKLNLCGHLHPGIRLRGMGRQHLRLPCYFLRKDQLILPAFGRFTGSAPVSVMAGDRIYAITPNKVIPLNLSDKVG